MRRTTCILGWLFALATLGVAGWEAFAPDPRAGFALRPLGQLWYQIDPGSLNLIQAVIERYVWPPLWDPVLVGLLQVPALIVFGVPAVVLLGLCYAWRRRRRRG